MIIKNDNLVIRSATVDDAQILTDWWNNGKIMEHAGFPNGLNQTIEKTINQIKRNEIGLSQLCIIDIDDIPVGEMSYNIRDKYGEIGIKICDFTYQNQGYGMKLISMLVSYLFNDETIKIDKIRLDTNLKNVRAQYFYEKFGFTKVRINENSWKDQLGNLQSSVDYEMTREKYESICKDR